MPHTLKNVTENEYEERNRDIKYKQNGTHRGTLKDNLSTGQCG